ncbi:putative transcriptional regulatory protein [Planctomycetes bacterium Pla163]|uniref:Probable transcriptional regulatory protein Pla163_25610 n=1 Tax=Rohdeia mirabilis TaxID=2528008 RepID=A0A518D1T3_9BACT|nr:putative transcriptional regulatory protein [Planctomycetes bacterium Pla163]
MAGHSHAANVARRKNAVDAKRAKIFSKCSKMILSAVKQGGPDPDQNLKLKYAVEKAKAANMPKDNIQRAIKSASGDNKGDMEELSYEGYAVGGVAVMVAALTDNRNRTAADIKFIFEKRGGNLGSPGSVSFMFDFRSIFVIETGERSEEQLMELALEVGADDVEFDAEASTLLADAKNFIEVKEALESQGVEFLSAEIGYVPQTTAKVATLEDAKKVMRLIDDLDDHEDVQTVYANYEFEDGWMEQLEG